MGDSAIAVEEGNAALGHSTPQTYVTSAETGMWEDVHSSCSRMGSSSKNADLSSATECSVRAQFGQNKCTQMKKKTLYQSKKAKIK